MSPISAGGARPMSSAFRTDPRNASPPAATNLKALLIGGLLPTVLRGIGTVPMKLRLKEGSSVPNYLVQVGFTVPCVGLLATAVGAGWVSTPRAQMFASLMGPAWAGAMGAMAYALSRHESGQASWPRGDGQSRFVRLVHQGLQSAIRDGAAAAFPIDASKNAFVGLSGIIRVPGPGWASSSAGRPSRLAPASPRRSRSSSCGRLRSSC